MVEKTKAEIERENKEKWLDEHLPYELMMLRYNFSRLTDDAGLFFLEWNTAHASFAVSAANLASFLTNGDTGRNNFKACDFVNGFRSQKGELAPVFLKMEPQIFHLGKSRPDGEGKFDINDIKRVYPWIEQEMEKFIKQLPADLKKYWNQARSIPPPKDKSLSVATLGPQSASSAAPQSWTGYKPQNEK